VHLLQRLACYAHEPVAVARSAGVFHVGAAQKAGLVFPEFLRRQLIQSHAVTQRLDEGQEIRRGLPARRRGQQVVDLGVALHLVGLREECRADQDIHHNASGQICGPSTEPD
jgi:hypothetical protein